MPTRTPAAILVLVFVLAVWNPASLALQAASSVDRLGTRPAASLVFLGVRLLLAGIGLAAGTSLWQRRPGAVGLAKLSLALFAIEAIVRLSTRVDLGSVPPGTRLPLAIVIVAHNASWYWYLRTSRRVRACYGLESS